MQEKRSAQPKNEISEPILREIESTRLLPAGITALDAVGAVMCVLAQRLSGGEARDLVAAMPGSLQAMLRPCAAHFERAESFDRGVFLDRVSDHLQVDYELAGHVTRAVFLAVRRRLSPEEINHVSVQLPKSLKEWWGPPVPLKISAHGLAAPDKATEKISGEIERQNILPPEIPAADAAAAVMCVLAQRLSGHEARHLLEELPATLRAVLQPCAQHFEQPDAFDREGFFSRVRQCLPIEENRVEAIVRAVFAAVGKQLSLETVERVAVQLPGDLKMLWGTSPTLMPVADPAFEAVAADLESRGVLPPRLPAADAVVAVMCVLAQRLSRGEARHLAALVPVTVRDAMSGCALHLEEPEIFDREEFLIRVSRNLDVDRRAAEEIARGVFTAVKKQIPPQEVRHVLSQLPRDLEELWGTFVPV